MKYKRNTECGRCTLSSRTEATRADGQRLYRCTKHFFELLADEPLQDVVFLPRAGADKERE